MKTYILTQEQLQQAVAKGVEALGLLSEAPKQPPQIYLVNNGAVVSFEDSPIRSQAPGPAATSLSSSSTPLTLPKVVPTEEAVKEALTKAMERPPGINSIRTYSPVQKKEAWAWAQAPSASPRPEFIKPRAPRGSKMQQRTATSESGFFRKTG